MATKDFRATRIEAARIIGSGSTGDQPGLIIHSASIRTNMEGGVSDATMLDHVGKDVFLFISGNMLHGSGSAAAEKRGQEHLRDGVTLFGGDVVISGTLFSHRQVMHVIEDTTAGDFQITGSLFQEPDANSTKSVEFRNAAGNPILSVDSSNQRVGIRDEAPGAILDIQGGVNSGVATLLIDHDDIDVTGVDINLATTTAIGIDVDASNTTANILDVRGTALTTASVAEFEDDSDSTGTRSVVKIKQDDSDATGTTALDVRIDGGHTGVLIDHNWDPSKIQTIKALSIDVDNAIAGTTSNTVYGISADLDYTNAVAGTNVMYGIKTTPTLSSVADAGSSTVYGVSSIATTNNAGSTHASQAAAGYFESTGGDTNYGLYVKTPDAASGIDVFIRSEADAGDYFSVKTAAAGETTITTVDNSAAAANLLMNIDGDVRVTPLGGNLFINNGAATPLDIFDLDAANTKLTIHDDQDTGDKFEITVAQHGATVIQTTDDDAAAANLDLIIDGYIKLDGDGVTIENDVDSGAYALHIDNNDVDQRALDISASNTTADVFKIAAAALTTGGAVNIGDSSTDTGTRSSFKVDQVRSAATGATAVDIIASSNGSVPAIRIDRNHSATTSSTPQGIYIDLDQTGEVANGQTVTSTGLKVDVETNNSAGVSIGTGIDVNITGDTDGVTKHIGAIITVGQGDGNVHLDLRSSADTDDKCEIKVAANGETTIETTDDSAANIGHLNIIADGNTILSNVSTNGVHIQSTTHTSGAMYLKEISAPGVSGEQVALYAKDISSTTKLFYKDSAGVEHGPLGSGGSLDNAYDTPSGGGASSPGAGGIISVDAQALQIRDAFPAYGKTTLVCSGAAMFGSSSVEFRNVGGASPGDHLPPMPGVDVRFFVSGALRTRENPGGSEGGMSVFGGDMLTSGSLYVSGTIFSHNQPNTYIDLNGDKGFLTLKSNNKQIISYEPAGTPPSITINGDGTAGSFLLKTGAKFALASKENSSPSPNTVYINSDNASEDGADTCFFVSGSKNSKNTAERGTSTFGGDMLTSGSLYVSGTIFSHSQPNTFLDLNGDKGFLTLKSNNHQILSYEPAGTPPSISINADGTAGSFLLKTGTKFALASKVNTAPSPNTVYINSDNASEDGVDTNFFVSGSINSKNTTERGTSTFGGDVVISGSLHARGQIELLRYSVNNVQNAGGNLLYLAAPSGDFNESNTNINNDKIYWVAPCSGSFKRFMINTQAANNAFALGLHLNQSVNPVSVFTGSIAANTPKEFNIARAQSGVKGSSPSTMVELTGSFSYDPGDLVTLSWDTFTGGAPGVTNITVLLENDVISGFWS